MAEIFGGHRRGPLTRDGSGPKSDVAGETGFCIEVKLLSRPTWGQLQMAVGQAERAAEAEGKGEEPIVIVRKKGDQKDDALVVQRLGTFREWRGLGE